MVKSSIILISSTLCNLDSSSLAPMWQSMLKLTTGCLYTTHPAQYIHRNLSPISLCLVRLDHQASVQIVLKSCWDCQCNTSSLR